MTLTGASILLRAERDPALSRLVPAATRAAAASGASVYLVGGCVRDLLLKTRLKDVDLAVEGDARAFAAALAAALHGRVMAASEFGTYRVEDAPGTRIDVAMARRESYAGPAALPRVVAAGIAEDLLRRDFTINSMAIRLSGPGGVELIDPSGGRGDLSRRILRLHHPLSLVDDPTRAFRAARYAARFGLRLAPSWAGALAHADHHRSFQRISAARLGREIALMWLEPDPGAAAHWAAGKGLFTRAGLPVRWSRALGSALRRTPAILRARDGDTGSALFFAILLESMSSRVRSRAGKRIGLHGTLRAGILAAASAAHRGGSIPGGKIGREQRLDPRFVERVALWPTLTFNAVHACGPSRTRILLDRCRVAWERSRPLLTGSDLMALGVPEGPRVGAILRALRRARLEQTVRDRAGEAALVRRLGSRNRAGS